MKKHLLLTVFLFVFLAGTAFADLTTDRSALYGDWTGSITLTSLLPGDSTQFQYNFNFTIGDDGTLAQGPDAGYYYIPSNPLVSSWTGTLLAGGQAADYTAFIQSGSQIFLFAGTPFSVWSAGCQAYFADDLLSAFLHGTAGWTAGGEDLAFQVDGMIAKATPIPGAVWLLGSGLLGLVGLRKRFTA